MNQALGHIARQCTVSRRATTRETQARGGQIKSSHLVNGLDGHQESGCWERSKRAAMEGASAILNTLTTGEPERGLSLGPKLRTGLLGEWNASNGTSGHRFAHYHFIAVLSVAGLVDAEG